MLSIFVFLVHCISPTIQNNSHYSGNFGHFLKQRKNLKTCQQVESTRERVEVSTALFWKLKGVTLFVGENAQIMRSMGKFLIENIVLGVPR